MQTYDYARAALWDTTIKFSLQSRAMTSPDHLVVYTTIHQFVRDIQNNVEIPKEYPEKGKKRS